MIGSQRVALFILVAALQTARGCPPGWIGEDCDQKCARGKYGDNCAEDCSGHCRHSRDCNFTTGDCPYGECAAGWMGDKCTKILVIGDINTQSDNSTMPSSIGIIIIISISIAALLLVVLLVVGLVLKRRANNIAINGPRVQMKKLRADDTVDLEGAAYIDQATASTPLVTPTTTQQSVRATDNQEEIYCEVDEHTYDRAESTQDPENNNMKPSVKPKAEKARKQDVKRRKTKVKIQELDQFTKSKLRDLPEEFNSIPNDLHPSEYGNSDKFERRNLYPRQYLPYDGNRVKLPTEKENSPADYINASYIHDYKGRKVFIAASGTPEAAVTYFWRMVWAEKIKHIIMLNGPQEGQPKRKAAVQYWPKTSSHTYSKEFTVIKVTEESTPCFTQRKFKVKKIGEDVQDDEEREVWHYHYHSWPDKSVPDRTSSLYDIRQIMKSNKSEEHPIVVQCNTGAGQTGTMIALDILLDQAEAERSVDVYETVYKLRQQRTHMVDALEQYQYLHRVLHEIYVLSNTAVLCSSLKKSTNPDSSEASHPNQLKKQFKYLRTMNPPKDMENKPTRENKSTGDEKSRIGLISGYGGARNYMAKEVPKADMASDFWRLVHEARCTTLICLQQDTNYTQWLPMSKDTNKTFEELKVTCQEEETLPVEGCSDITVLDINIEPLSSTVITHARNSGSETEDSDNSTVYMKVYLVSDWSSKDNAENDCAKKLDAMFGHVKRWQENIQSKLLTAMCLNGADESGLLLASFFLMEMAQEEKKVDVYHAVKVIREGRPELISSHDQYVKLFNVIKQYVVNLPPDGNSEN